METKKIITILIVLATFYFIFQLLSSGLIAVLMANILYLPISLIVLGGLGFLIWKLVKNVLK